MTLSQATALSTVKNMLFLTDTNVFDTALNTAFPLAVDRLAPYVSKEQNPHIVDITVDNYGEAIVDFTTLPSPAIDDVRLVEIRDSDAWQDAENTYRHGTKLYITGLETNITQARLWGLQDYVVVANTIDIPSSLQHPIFWYMMSEFYSYLAADRSRYNIYSQSLGSRAVESLDSESEYYATKATNYLTERAQMRGSQ